MQQRSTISSQTLTYSRKITAQENSNLWFCARQLDIFKRDVFDVAYATMRLVDDWVDNGSFAQMGLNPEDVEILLDQYKNHQTRYDKIQHKQLFEDHRSRYFLDAFRFLFISVGIHPQPWVNLLHALRQDKEQQCLHSWHDFDSYINNVAVAPAQCFLQILALNNDTLAGNDGHMDTYQAAHAIGRYCYLVHILRDLKKDSKKAVQLLTLPEELLHSVDIKDTSELAAVINHPASSGVHAYKLEALCTQLLDHIQHQRVQAMFYCNGWIKTLPENEGRVLDLVLHIYLDIEDYLRSQKTLPVEIDHHYLKKRRMLLMQSCFENTASN